MTKTLIVIGAGTSMGIHSSFPSGIQLANLIDVHLITTKKRTTDKYYHFTVPYISSMINEAFKIFNHDVIYFDTLIDDLKRELWGYVQEYYYHEIGAGANYPISIDSLISQKFNNTPDISNLAKQCIAYHLKGQESAFIRKVNKSGPNLPDTWVNSLFNILKSKGWTLNDIQNNLHVISFNYERTFEYLACASIKKVFNEDISHLPFVEYIYGNIGSLSDVPFEEKNDTTNKMKNCFKSIKLIGERHDIKNKPRLDDYERVLFIGFGYDKDNLNDTLSVQNVKSAKLYGMCREKRDLYIKAENDFKISITAHGNKIEDFLNTRMT